MEEAHSEIGSAIVIDSANSAVFPKPKFDEPGDWILSGMPYPGGRIDGRNGPDACLEPSGKQDHKKNVFFWIDS